MVALHVGWLAYINPEKWNEYYQACDHVVFQVIIIYRTLDMTAHTFDRHFQSWQWSV